VISSRHSSCSVHHIFMSFLTRGPNREGPPPPRGPEKCEKSRPVTSVVPVDGSEIRLTSWGLVVYPMSYKGFKNIPLLVFWGISATLQSIPDDTSLTPTKAHSNFQHPVVSQICMWKIEITRHKRSWDTHKSVEHIHMLQKKISYMNNICIMYIYMYIYIHDHYYRTSHTYMYILIFIYIYMSIKLYILQIQKYVYPRPKFWKIGAIKWCWSTPDKVNRSNGF